MYIYIYMHSHINIYMHMWYPDTMTYTYANEHMYMTLAHPTLPDFTASIHRRMSNTLDPHTTWARLHAIGSRTHMLSMYTSTDTHA